MPSGTAAVAKLFTDTVYGIQKDVLKVALLALASVVYRALKDNVHSDLRSIVLQGGPAGLVLVAITGYMLVILNSPQHNELSDARAAASSPSPLEYVRTHPLAIGVTVATVFAIDRYNLLVGLERLAIREARHFLDIAGPALHRVLTLARPKAPVNPQPPLWLRTVRWLVPSAATAQLVLALVRARASRIAAALLEAQRQELLRTRARWKSVFEFVASIIGLGSAMKYLLR